ncbi:MAG: hypothetical protein WDN28_00105 [Chthoniobacter sp.]
MSFSGPSVQIDFHSPSGKGQTLYYFKTDLSNGGGNASFLAFCKHHGPGASLLKSASYLMHEESFSTIRNFLLANSTLIIQDDSGIPYRALRPAPLERETLRRLRWSDRSFLA